MVLAGDESMGRTRSAQAGRRGKPVRQRARSAGSRGDPVELALASFAHEIRTPLNGILALAELIAASSLPERERGWAASLRGAAQHLARLTTLIVDGARAQAHGLALGREEFDPRALAHEVAASLSARAAAKDLASETRIADDLPPTVVGDPVRLRAVLENLIDNAVKFTAAGRIAFAASAKPADDGRVRLIFIVEDQGPGLRKSELDRLFRPFAQGSDEVGRRFGGAGLGLALARNIARAMGGDLTVRSAPPSGSAFRLEIAAERASDTAVRGANAAPPPSADRTAPHTPARPLRILCAEDNPYGRVVLNTVVSALGHSAEFVEDGDAAVAAVRKNPYDLILIDLVLPGISGLAATRRIRALPGGPGKVPIIGLSGRSGARVVQQAHAAGMDRYLVKPVSPSALAAALGEIIDGRTRPSPARSRRR